jgi:AraC family transcriptional regulator, transcriptional activator FtrA
MKRILLRILIYSVCFIIPLLVAGGLGYVLSMQAAMSPAPESLVNSVGTNPAPNYDANKPTVAIVLGDPLSEVTDVLGPYTLFAMSEKYNVYTVASSKTLQTLTGNLDILPHFSFEELETLLGGSPDVIVVPAIPDINAAQNTSLLAWLDEHKNDSLLFSWCTGAEVLAAAGLLKGKEATTHWADLGGLERKYPDVKWQRGLRYVDHGSLLTSAGLTSGIDATLYLLAKRHGDALAGKIARDIHYPSFQFVSAPQIEQYTLQAKDSIYGRTIGG